MLERVDRVLLVVQDAKAATETFGRLLGTEVAGQHKSSLLGAQVTRLALGESELELMEPFGSGVTADFLARRGEGLFAAGMATNYLEKLRERFQRLGITHETDNGRLFLPGEHHFGVPFLISPMVPRVRVGVVSFLYEVTNTLVSDWHGAAVHFSGLFGLDPQRFSPIGSKRFGYEGTLTLFNPPERLDRIELSQVTNSNSAMGRWVAKHGDSLYMCYCETHDFPGLKERLNANGARWTPRGETQEGELDGNWIHPSSLHGLLLGVSRTTLGWEWSGRPELVVPL